MEAEIKELLQSPKFLYGAAAILSLTLAAVCYDGYKSATYDDPFDEKINLNFSEPVTEKQESVTPSQNISNIVTDAILNNLIYSISMGPKTGVKQ